MRVYLPVTSTSLRELADTGAIGPAPLTAFAVTPGLREWYLDDDAESLEYAALSEAARGSLRLIDGDLTAVRRRGVVAVDVPDAEIENLDDLERGAVRLAQAVTLASIASIHVDDADAQETVRRAAEAIIAADLGDAGSQELVDDAEGFELSWFANQELAAVLDSF